MSICCSPPEIRPAQRPSSGSISGNSSIALSIDTPPSFKLSATEQRPDGRPLLGHERGAARGPAVQRLVDRLALPLHLTGERPQLSGEREERRALARTVGPEHEQHLARSHLEVDVAHCRLVVVARREPVGREQRFGTRGHRGHPWQSRGLLVSEVGLDHAAVASDGLGVAVRR